VQTAHRRVRCLTAAAFGLALGAAAIWHTGVGAQEATFYSGPVAPLTAAVWNERLDDLRRLLTDGANPNWPEGKPPFTPWQVAVLVGDQPSLDLFASHEVTRPASHYTPTLFKVALQRGDARLVSTFLRGGALPTFSDAEYSPLSIAAASGYDDVMQVLLGAGADANAQNRFGDTALMAAVRSGRLEAVQLLLDRGATLTPKDRDGRDAMAWAERMGRKSIVHALVARGAVESSVAEAQTRQLMPVRTAAAKSLVLLQGAGAAWLERAACASCHHQGLLLPVAAVARRQGFALNETQAHAQEVRLRSMLTSMAPGFRAAFDDQDAAVRFGLGFFGQAASGNAWLLAALAARPGRGGPLDETLAVMIGRTQLSNGRWRVGAPRLPIQDSDIQTTALAIRVLLTFAPSHHDTASRVEQARAWLLASEASTTLDRAYRLFGLTWAGADRVDVREAMKELLKAQEDDGGWAQVPGLNADAYATGLALVALHEAGEMSAFHHAYQRGVAYLMRTQEDDGSWLVHKRAASFNPYFESGFPHGMFQFSSFAGTAWATMGLMYAAGQSSP
jgi:hypothetical protein